MDSNLYNINTDLEEPLPPESQFLQNPPSGHKEVVFVTPILLGQTNFPQIIDPRTVQYKRNECFDHEEVPAICSTLPLSMVIDLPDDNLDQYAG